MMDFICMNLTGKICSCERRQSPNRSRAWFGLLVLARAPPSSYRSRMAPLAAIGFKLHTGWAAAVAISGGPGELQGPLRRRVELLPSSNPSLRFVYHEASKLPASQAEEFVRRARATAQETARIAVADILAYIRAHNFEIRAAGISLSSRTVPADLSVVLRSHPVIHTAEGVLFQQVVASACADNGLKVISAREREIWSNAAGAWGLKEAELRKQIDGLRKSMGAPWATDQKIAAAYAMLALRREDA